MNQTQINTLHKLATGDPIQVFGRTTVEPLIAEGYVRRVRLDPMPDPEVGVPVNITAKGRGVVEREAPADD